MHLNIKNQNNVVKFFSHLVKSIRYFGVGGIKFHMHQTAYRLCRICNITIKKSRRISRLRYKTAEGRQDLFYRPYTSDVPLIHSILVWNREYDINLEKSKFDTILDLGANIGLFSILYGNRFRGKKIVAVEPEPENYKILCKNINNKAVSIIPFKSGIWWRKAKLELVDNESNWGFTVKETFNNERVFSGGGNGGTLLGIDIDSLCEQFHITGNLLIKMDIEGTEKELFEHIDHARWLEKTAYLIMEIHGGEESGLYKSICKEMVGRGYSIAKRGENIIFEKLSIS